MLVKRIRYLVMPSPYVTVLAGVISAGLHADSCLLAGTCLAVPIGL